MLIGLRACRLWRLAFIAGLLGTATSAPAVTFVVDTTADAPDASPGDGTCATASGGCSLRAAVQETNALAGADTISLPAGLYLLTLGSDDTDLSGDLDVKDALTITGAGAAATIVDANHASRVFDVGPGSSSFAVSGVTIRNGDTTAFGGGVSAFFTAPVSLTDCVVTGNRADIGGGIVALRGLSLTNTTVSDNSAVTAAGGLGTNGGTIRGSTFARNTVSGAGGVGRDILTSGAGTLTILNSTVEDEIRNFAYCVPTPLEPECIPGTDIVLANATVGSITFLSNVPGGSFTARNSIIRSCEFLTLTSQGHNLIETSFCSITGDTTGNVVGVDPLLGPLAANGGPTETHEPLPGSPVLDAGDPAAPGSGGTACEATDQRGVARPQGPRCDIGAVELVVAAPSKCPVSQSSWKNHPSGWPVLSLILGSQTYTQSELMTILRTPIGYRRRADASLILARQLIAAKLNLANGSDPTPVASTIADADSLLSAFAGKLPYNVKPSSATGQTMVNDANVLDSYNNGQLTAECCGNGVVDTGETCDDGNSESGDGCSASCQLEGSPRGAFPELPGAVF